MTQLAMWETFDADRRALIPWTPKPPPVLTHVKKIYLDCETDGLEWWAGARPIGIAIGWVENGRFVSRYLPWGHRGGGNLPEEVVKRWARQELRDKEINNLNTKFDVHHMCEWGVDLEAQGNTVSDVANYAALLNDHRKRFSLEALSQDYLGEGKVKGVDGKRMAEYHAGEVAAYACRDVELVWKLEKMLLPFLDAEGLQTVCQLEDDIIYPVCEMERNASPLNMELLVAWRKQIESKYHAMLWQVYTETGVRIDSFTAPKELEKLFNKLGVKVPRTPKSKQIRTDADTIADIEHPISSFILKAQKMHGLLSRYLWPYEESASRNNGLLRYHLHQLRTDEGGTVSGRFSSTDHNIQQVLAVEKQMDNYGHAWIIRELFVAEPGREWLSADADQIEYRLFAHYANSEKILARYREDPTVNLHHVVREMVLPFVAEIAYKQVKNLNFAKVYGAGINKVAFMLGVDRATAERFVRVYDRQFPEAGKLLKKAMSIAERRGFVKTIMGRRCRFPKSIPLEDRRIHKALNGVIQGSAADEMKLKLIALHERRKETGMKMRLTNHDEVCGDVDKGDDKKVSEILNEQTLKTRVPLFWSVDTGPHWASCDDKWQELAA